MLSRVDIVDSVSGKVISTSVVNRVTARQFADSLPAGTAFVALHNGSQLLADDILPDGSVIRIIPQGGDTPQESVENARKGTSIAGFGMMLAGGIMVGTGVGGVWGASLLLSGAGMALSGLASNVGSGYDDSNANYENYAPITGNNEKNLGNPVEVLCGQSRYAPNYALAKDYRVESNALYIDHYFCVGLGEIVPFDLYVNNSLEGYVTKATGWAPVSTGLYPIISDAEIIDDPIVYPRFYKKRQSVEIGARLARGGVTSSTILASIDVYGDAFELIFSRMPTGKNLAITYDIDIYDDTGAFIKTEQIQLNNIPSNVYYKTLRIDMRPALGVGNYTLKVHTIATIPSNISLIDYLSVVIAEDSTKDSMSSYAMEAGSYLKVTTSAYMIDVVSRVSADEFKDFVISCGASQVVSGLDSNLNIVTTGFLSNPADIALTILLNSKILRKSVGSSKLDLKAFYDFQQYCLDKGYLFNNLYTSETTLRKILSDVLSAGRGSLSIKDGKISIAVDKEGKVPVQLFTNRTARDFNATKSFGDKIHAFKCRAKIEPLYEETEIVVYADGYDNTNATNIRELPLVGVSTHSLVWKHARFALACLEHRPEVFSFTAFADNVRCTRGDLVAIQYDTPLMALTSFRIASVGVSSIVADDVIPSQEVGANYSVIIRKSTGELVSVDNVIRTDSVTLSFSVPSGVSVGDLVSYGVTGSEYVECLVTAIDPQDDLRARITLVEYSPVVFTADQGTIPVYNPNISISVTSDVVYGNQTLDLIGSVQSQIDELTADYLLTEDGLIIQTEDGLNIIV